MIVPMTKYNFVVLHSQRDAFLETLRELGLVDITTTGWEPNEQESKTVRTIEQLNGAIENLKPIEIKGSYTPFESGREALRAYKTSVETTKKIKEDIGELEKNAAEVKVWGKFDRQTIENLASNNVAVRLFYVSTREFEKSAEEWGLQYDIVPINSYNSNVYFAVVTTPDMKVDIPAREVGIPQEDYTDLEKEIAKKQHQHEEQTDVMNRCAASIRLLEEEKNRLTEELQFSKIANSSLKEGEGTLIVMEGWATRSTSEKVDAMLNDHPNMLYLKARPTPEDNTPVLLENNRFFQTFEFIGDLYAKPKYGTMDLTPFFAPFYILFFGMCLGDSGYGLLILLVGWFLTKKGDGKMMKNFGKFALYCGISTMIMGTLMGSFFGIQLANLEVFAGMKKYFITSTSLFPLSLMIGVVQILFGMVLKAVTLTRQFGFRYALSTIGWMVTLLSVLVSKLLKPSWFAFDSMPFLIVFGLGVFMMLFLNSPGKNPLVNLGSGLWNTYNNVTGLLSDVLSYVRLFAIGIAGGVLAMVFNQLAFGLSPDIPVVREITIVLILLIGHGINLFMSTLSSFVHPMRLTFVEFFKNAGFEMSNREFSPLKKIND